MDEKILSMYSEQRINKLRAVVSKRQAGFAVVLEDVHDPHNAAAVMRTADSLGITDIRLVFTKETPYDPKTIGKASSSSANKWMDFRIYDRMHDCIADLKTEGYHTVATALTPDAITMDSTDLSGERIAVIFGNEHAGVSPETIKLADTVMFLPMLGMVQSLNISVTAAIVMTEITRRRRETGKNYFLTPEKQTALLDDYLTR